MSQHSPSRNAYLAVYVALLLLLVATVGASFIDIGRGYNDTIAIGIGAIKAVLIVLVFMHIGYQPWLNWFFAASGFIWLSIMLTLSITEYVGRNHPPGVNPKGEPRYLVPQAAQRHADTGYRE